jgi:hypothetical protein
VENELTCDLVHTLLCIRARASPRPTCASSSNTLTGSADAPLTACPGDRMPWCASHWHRITGCASRCFSTLHHRLGSGPAHLYRTDLEKRDYFVALGPAFKG